MRTPRFHSRSTFLNALKRGGKRRRPAQLSLDGAAVSATQAESLEQRALLAGTPVAVSSITPPEEVFIGEDFNLTVTFDNTGTAEGYGPILDLVLPTNGADGQAGASTADGLSTTGPATYLGAPVTTLEFVFPDDGGGIGTIDHPYFVDNANAPLQVSGTTGDTLVVMQLPFGSFTPDQPAAALTLPVSMSNFADANTSLNLQSRAGFQYGCDEIDNPASDPSLVSDDAVDSSTWGATSAVSPILVKLTKTNLAPEMETATGPNFVRQYEIVVDVAEGQTLTNLDVTDYLPPEIVYMGDGTVTVTPALGESVVTSPNTDKPYAAPDNELTVRIPSVTGGADNEGFTLTFDFYVARLEADDTTSVLDPDSGDDELSLNEAFAAGNWDPTDGRDSTESVTAHEELLLHDDELEDKSIAIQKSVSNVTDAQNTPGDVLEYTLNFQISDFFAFEDVNVDDLLSDGQRFDDSFVPTLRFVENGVTTDLPFGTSNFTIADNFTGTSDQGFTEGNPNTTHVVDNAIALGSQELRFRISDELASRTGQDNRLVGGCVPDAGVGAGAPDCSVFNGGATTGTIVYRTIIQESFSDDAPSTDNSVDQGDQLSNTVLIDGAILDNADATTANGSREADNSGAIVTIARGSLQKSIYAINGSTAFPTDPVEVTPGDEVTYRIQLDIPSSDIEDLEFVDYLPLPLFDATELTGVDDVTDAAIPAAGRIKFLDDDGIGPNGDTFSGAGGVSGIVPTLTALPGNAFSILYGNFDSGVSARSDVDILFTVTVQDKEFADGLFHTNQVRQLEGSTNAGPANQDSIVQIRINEPSLNVQKGVIATSNSNGSFTNSVGPVSFTAPGTAGFRGSGTVHSDGLAATPINSDLDDIDAGDLVSFALVVENTGSSRRGAFDIQLRDTLPAGFSIPSTGAGLNLTVTDGTGSVLTTVPIDGTDTVPLFENGLEILDPGATTAQADQTDAGALDEYDATDGQNILIVTYDLIADNTVEPDEPLTNTVTLFNYSSLEGGEDYTTSDKIDTAVVTTAAPTVTKTVDATNQVHTAGNEVAIGEIVTYEVVVDIPEGVSTGVTLVDTLDAGLAFVDGSLSIVPSSGNITFTGSGTAAFSDVGSGTTAAGRRMTIDFGDVTNSNSTTDTTTESFTLTYDVVVLNTSQNDRGDGRNNSARWGWSEGAVTDGAPNVTIVEPQLDVTKSFGAGTSGEAGDPFTVTLDIEHHTSSNADAFNVTLEDVLPTGMSFAGSLAHTGGLAPDTLTESGGTISASWTTFTESDTSSITFDVVLTGAVVPGTTVTNNATSEWTSLPGSVLTAQTSTNPNSTERTGDPADPGATNDHTDTGSDGIDIIIPVPTKSIVATSESHTSGADLAVGEIVRYRLDAILPQGTSPDFRLIDHLPNGLSLLDTSEVRVSWSADTDVTELAALSGADNAAVPPTFVLPASRITTTGSNITFDLGDLVNNDDDADVETVTLEFNAIATNVAVNSIPFTHDNTFTVEVNGNEVATSAPITTTLVEPVISNVDKSVLNIGTDVVTYEVTFSNTGTATAFEVNFADALPGADLGLQLGTVSFTPAGGATGVVNTSAGNTVSATIATMPVGSSITVQYTADVLTAGSGISNSANVTYTSLPDGGTAVNATGSTTPVGGERDGSGGVNDYSDTDTEQIGAIGDFVWLDTDSGSDQDPGEPGIGGVDVQLVWPGPDGSFASAGDNVTLTTTTDNDGFYTFNGLPGSDYRISILTGTLPGALTPTADLDGTGTANTATATLAAGQVRDDVDFGYAGPGSIGDTIFLDVDGDDSPDAGEGISGVTVTLTGDLDGDGIDEVLTTTTGADGSYLFDGLPVDTGTGSVDYTVAVVTASLPAGVSLSYDPEGAADNTSNVTLSPGSPDALDQDYGYQSNGRIGDTIFLDANNNGIPDPGEGIADVEVTLTGDHDGDGVDEVLRTTTDQDGNYVFSGLVTDDGSGGGVQYTVDVVTSTLPDGVSQTVDPDGTTDDSSATTLTNAANTDLTRDFGYQSSGQIGDTIFLDANNNGTPDPGEGISGVRVTLTGDHDGDGVDEVLTTTTDADGNYLFDGLVTNDGTGAGIEYTVDVDPTTLPDGVAQSADPDGTNDNSSTTTLTDASDTDLTRDFGYQATGQIGDTIFLDANNNGTPDPGEGIAGVRVTLTGDHDGDGTDEILTATTDTDGNYLFDGLVTNDGSGGGVQYTVDVDTSTLPDGAAQTVDPDGTTDNSSTTTLTDAADTDLTRDFGYRSDGRIGDTIFLDANNNGVPDPGEGISGVTVTLTADQDGDGTDEVLSTTTDSNGNYVFIGLVTNDGSGGGIPYTVDVDTGTLPAGVTNTTDPDGTTDDSSSTTLTDASPINLDLDFGYRGDGAIGDTVFIDTNSDGVPTTGEGITGATVTLTGDFDGDGLDEVLTTTTGPDGAYLFDGLVTSPTGIDYTVAVDPASLPTGISQTVDPDSTLDDTSNVTLTDLADSDLNQDFGYQGPGSIGDTVFLDVNGNGVPDPGEGLGGVEVTLTTDLDGDAVPDVVTTTTADDGTYLFEGLPTDNGAGGGVPYAVQINTATLPLGVTNTTDPDGGAANVSNLTLTNANSDRLDQDFGYRGNGVIGDTVFLDSDLSGSPDPGEGFDGVTVTLTADTDGDGIDEVLTTTTDANGNYRFEGLPTDDGTGEFNYQVDVVYSTLPAAYLPAIDPDSALDNQSQVRLTDALPSDLAQDFGYIGNGSIGDTVFLDVNGNGQPDSGEGISGVTVNLVGDFDGDGTDDVRSTVTDEDGNYLFDTLPTDDGSGSFDYQVRVLTNTLPEGVTNTTDPDGGTRHRSDVQLTGTRENDLDQDFGYMGPGEIGDTIFLDANNNGQPDPGEGIGGVTVELVGDFDGDGRTEKVKTTTDRDGRYLFQGLPVDDGTGSGITYTVKVDQEKNLGGTTLPEGVSNTADPDGGLNGRSQTTLSNANPVDYDQDFGYMAEGQIGDTIFLDLNDNGQPDPGEGIGGVTVELVSDFDGDGTVEKFKTTTAPDGTYLFEGLPTDDGSGRASYTVKVDQEKDAERTLPDGVTNSTDPDGGNNNRSAVTLRNTRPTNLNQDFGYQGTGVIGDKVFLDVSGNGKSSSGEGLSNVEVELITDIDGDGIVDKFSTVTDNDGNYRFENLPVADVGTDYRVRINQDTLPAGVTNTADPDGGASHRSDLTLTSANSIDLEQDFGYRGVGSIGDTVFQDIDGDGQPSPGEGIARVTVELVGDFDNDGKAEKVRTKTNANGEYEFTGLPVEATNGGGIVYRVKVDKEVGSVGDTIPATLKNTVDPHGGKNGWSEVSLTNSSPDDADQDFGYAAKGEIGDRVFLDADGDGRWDEGEGIPNVDVSLTGDFDGDGRTDKVTVTTDADGLYRFQGLIRGQDYTVEIDADTVPETYINEFDPDGGRDLQADLTLNVRRDLKQDFGFIQPVNLSITKDNTHVYDSALPGEDYEYEIVVTNDGPGAALNAKVVDRMPDEIVAATWTADASSGVDYRRSGTGDIVEFVTIPSGGSITYTIVARTADDFEGTVVNEARVKTSSRQPELDTSDNIDKDRTTVAEMNIIDLNTPIEGTPTTLSSRGQTNDASLVLFFASRRLGTHDVPNSGITLGLDDPILIGTGFLCDAGTIEVIWDVPEDSAGQTWYVQSAERDPVERVSNVQELRVGSASAGGSGNLLSDDHNHSHELDQDFANIEGHILTISGTEDDDQVQVDVEGNDVTIEVNGERLQLNAAELHLHRIDVRTGDGDDKVQIIRSDEHPTDLHGGFSIQAGDGNDQVLTENVDILIRGNAGDDTINTTANGTDGVLIEAGIGNDTVAVHGTARTQIFGGEGNDTLSGGDSADAIFGESGNDLIRSNGGNDRVRAGAGDDTVFGGRGRDIIIGSEGNDQLHGGFANDLVLGGEGIDDVRGGRGSDIIVTDKMAFEHDMRRLTSIRTDWQQADTMQQRIEALRNSQTGMLRQSIVSDDNSDDVALGGQGLDVFFASLASDETDAETREGLFDSI